MRDRHTLRALREGYKGRAVYKIQEIDKRFRIIKKESKVLDLGCYPGSWIQYLTEKQCNVVGVDVKNVKGLKFKFIRKDVYDKDIFEKLDSDFDSVISDLAPNTTGIRDLDQERSLDLCYRALEIADKVLKSKDVEKRFKYARVFKPKVSKKRSKEIYIIAKLKFQS